MPTRKPSDVTRPGPHPVADLFPMLDDDELGHLAASIKPTG